MRSPKLNVVLPPDWQDVSAELPEGPPTYVRGETGAGALQISIQSVYRSGPEPDPTSSDLIRLSEHVANLQEAEITSRYSGDCVIGRFGCVIGKSADLARIQIWTLSNGRDFVLATYLCTDAPEALEALQAERIVKATTLH
jgi:hypothetical protein